MKNKTMIEHYTEQLKNVDQKNLRKLSIKVGISHTALWRQLNGISKPTLTVISALLDAGLIKPYYQDEK